jgi:hypothetical protein
VPGPTPSCVAIRMTGWARSGSRSHVARRPSEVTASGDSPSGGAESSGAESGCRWGGWSGSDGPLSQGEGAIAVFRQRAGASSPVTGDHVDASGGKPQPGTGLPMCQAIEVDDASLRPPAPAGARRHCSRMSADGLKRPRRAWHHRAGRGSIRRRPRGFPSGRRNRSAASADDDAVPRLDHPAGAPRHRVCRVSIASAGFIGRPTARLRGILPRLQAPRGAAVERLPAPRSARRANTR